MILTVVNTQLLRIFDSKTSLSLKSIKILRPEVTKILRIILKKLCEFPFSILAFKNLISYQQSTWHVLTPFCSVWKILDFELSLLTTIPNSPINIDWIQDGKELCNLGHYY